MLNSGGSSAAGNGAPHRTLPGGLHPRRKPGLHWLACCLWSTPTHFYLHACLLACWLQSSPSITMLLRCTCWAIHGCHARIMMGCKHASVFRQALCAAYAAGRAWLTHMPLLCTGTILQVQPAVRGRSQGKWSSAVCCVLRLCSPSATAGSLSGSLHAAATTHALATSAAPAWCSHQQPSFRMMGQCAGCISIGLVTIGLVASLAAACGHMLI